MEITYIPISLVVEMWGAINEQTGFLLKNGSIFFSQGGYTVNSNGFIGKFYCDENACPF